MSAPQLRPYQEASLNAIVSTLQQGLTRQLIKKPTGTGKTVTFAQLLSWPGLKAWLAAQPKGRGAQLLVIAHREELLDQAAAKIQAANPGLMVSIEQGDRKAHPFSDVVIASIQTLAAPRGKFARLKRLLQYHAPRLVVVDEAHHAAAPSYRTALVHLGFLPPADASESEETEAANFEDVAVMAQALEGWDRVAPKDRLLLGFTATPNRTDAIGLGCVFQTIAYSYDLKRAIEDGWLTAIKPWVIETAESLDQVRTTAGEFNQKDLAEAVNKERRNRLAFDAWQMYAGDRPTLGFTVDVAHAHACAELWVSRGIKAAALSGETPKDERRQMLADYTAGKLQVIFNCMVLTEGTDLPLTSCILHLKPTKSSTLYEQMTGRGLRPLPGDPVGPERIAAIARGVTLRKAECLVIDLVDVARRHSLMAAPVLYGLPPGIKAKGEDLRKIETDLEALRAKHQGVDFDKLLAEGRYSMRELLDRASTFDVWSVPELGAVGDGLTMRWITMGPETYRLSYPWADGTEVLQVGKDLLGHFELSCTLRPHGEPGMAPQPPRQRTLATGVTSANAALKLAEAYVAAERRSVSKLKDQDAPWRKRPASPKQLDLLRKWKVPHNPKSLTMGGASDLIDLAKARRTR